MKVDSAGNVYCGGPGGIWIMDAKGKKLAASSTRAGHNQHRLRRRRLEDALFYQPDFLGSVAVRSQAFPFRRGKTRLPRRTHPEIPSLAGGDPHCRLRVKRRMLSAGLASSS